MAPSKPLHRLTLTKPLAFFDIESTGIHPRTDRIIDLAVVVLFPSGERRIHTFRFNPGIPIPPETTAIHGIRDADVKDCKSFEDQADAVARTFEDHDLAGYNILRFDIPILIEEFLRAGHTFDIDSRRIIDSQRIFHKREPRDLSAALRFYCGEMHLGAHGAEADTLATIQILEGQLQRYGDLPGDIATLHDYCNDRNPDWVDKTGRLRWQNRDIVLNFGRKRGESLRTLARQDPGFIRWLLNSDFPRDMQEIVRKGIQDDQWPAPPPPTVTP